VVAIKIIIADDHAVVRDGLQILLEAQPDMEVVGVASNGNEAIDQTKRHLPDIVIMDIAMPGLNGIDATHRIAETCPETHVLILSMHSTAEHIYRALQAGAAGYLLKESAGAEVVAAVRAACSGKRYLSQKITETVVNDYITERVRASPLDSLSPRERQILQMTAEGRTTADIAKALSLSPKTVETYRSRSMQKLGLSDLSALVKFAIQHGLTTLE
jgi:DNA-binding NarL/FixJ family response regulator